MRFQCPFCRFIVAVDNDDCGIDVQCGQCGEIITVPLSRLSTGSVIADFIILEEIGSGGMGVVYRAHQISLDRPSALKILSDRYARNAEYVVGFIREARAAAKLNHPHIVQAYAVGEDEGIFYFAMEYIDGETMKAVLKRKNLIPVDKALTIIQQVAEALDHAWKEQRLIHRDIKPDNIMLTKNGRAKLADLGLARVASEIDDSPEGDEVMGTPQYISPEHLVGASMDIRSDIYSLGATFYHLITGQFPFTGKTPAEIAKKHLDSPLISPKEKNPEIPESLCCIIEKMMEKSPEKRYQSAEELVEDLSLVRRGKMPMSLHEKKHDRSDRILKQATVSFSDSSIAIPEIAEIRKIRTGQLKIPTPGSSSLRLKHTGPISGPLGQVGVDFTTRRMREEKERMAKRQIIAWAVVCFVVVILAIAYVILAGKKAPQTTTRPSARPAAIRETHVSESPGTVSQKPEKTKYVEKVEEILAYANKNPQNDSDILVKCDSFFGEFNVPGDEYEREALANLLQLFVPLDEKIRVLEERKNAHNKHLALLSQRKADEERKQKELELKRREKEREAEVARLKKEQEEKEKKRLEEYRQNQKIRKESLCYCYINHIKRKNFKTARSSFDSAVEEESKVSELMKKDAADFALWGKKMQESIDSAERLWNELSNSGDKLAGTPLEVKPGVLGDIIAIRDGQVSVKTISGKKEAVPLSALPIKQFKILAKKIAPTLGENSAPFHYMLASGEFEETKELTADPEWKERASEIIYSYLKVELENISKMPQESMRQEMKNLHKRYRSLPEFFKALKTVKSD